MAWRGVVIARPARLTLAAGCCLVDAEDGPVRLAFEDIAYLVLDTPQVSLTSAVLARFAEENVLVIACDGRHLPTGALLPLQGHHRQVASLRLQLAAPPGLKSKIWRFLVRAKVENQARVLDLMGREGGAGLVAMAGRVDRDDPDQIEARAARDYFPRMFDDFRRRDDGDLRNAMLNYAYAVVRAGLARALAAQGFHPALGIHHDGVGNPFNLADDLIEPWRPIADHHVARHLGDRPLGDRDDEDPDLTVADRRELARVLVSDIAMGEETTTALVGVERMVDGLYAALDHRDASLVPRPRPMAHPMAPSAQ